MKKIANFIKNNKAQLSLTVIMVLYFLFFLFTSCKPKEIITERVVTRIDSTAVLHLQDELYKKDVRIEILQTDLERVKTENYSLQGEISKWEIYYDTSQPVDPETGKPPISSEITTVSKSWLERTIQEYETLKQEARIENEKLTKKNLNLELIVETLRNENRDLKEKTTPTTGFNFKLFLWGMLAGVIISVAAYFAIRKVIKI